MVSMLHNILVAFLVTTRNGMLHDKSISHPDRCLKKKKGSINLLKEFTTQVRKNQYQIMPEVLSKAEFMNIFCSTSR